MRSMWTVIARHAFGLAGFLALASGTARAQGSSLRGVVVDTVGVAIGNADIGIAALRRLTRTDELGRFWLDKLAPGDVEVSIRRLGYEPQRVRVSIQAATTDSLHIVLVANAMLLAGVDVSAAEIRLRRSIEDFYRRRVHGTGQYITRDQIEGRLGGNPSDMLRNTPGVRLIRSANGGYAVRFPNTSLSRFDCAPLIWVDGQKAPGLEIDDIPLRDVEGIEVYNGPATTPMQFTAGHSMTSCGTIVVWSRPPQYTIYKRAP